jgi:hypothetical protein
LRFERAGRIRRERLQEHLDVGSARDAAFAQAQNLSGPAKARALFAGLETMKLDEETVFTFYGSVIDEIKAADPKDESGLTEKIEMAREFAEFRKRLSELSRSDNRKAAFELVRETLASETLAVAYKQRVASFKVRLLARDKDYDAAVRSIEELIALDPTSRFAGQMAAYARHLQTMREREEAAKAEDEDEDE